MTEGERTGRLMDSNKPDRKRPSVASRRNPAVHPRKRDVYVGVPGRHTVTPGYRPRSSHDVYVGAPARKRPRRTVAAIVAGVVAVALVVLAAFAIPRIAGGPAAPDGSGQGAPAAGEVPVSDVSAEGATDGAAQPVSFTVSFAGDCTLGMDESFDPDVSFNACYEAEGDPSYFFRNVHGLFAADDLTVVNMEGTLTESDERADKTFAFKGPADYAQVLAAGSVEAASLANNHSRDYGEQSYADTAAALQAAGIMPFGYDDIAFVDVKGVKVALVGAYELAEHEGMRDSLVANVQRARDEGAQVVLVYFHWGVERETVPSETQMLLGRAAIDAGADLVVGSHPHVIQGWEKYHDRYIVYSLGNFCFGGNSNPADKDCMIFQQTFTVAGDDVARDDAVELIPCTISSTPERNDYQPTPAEGDEAARIDAKIQESSDAIAAQAAGLDAA